MRDATTLDLERTGSWTNEEAREARRLQLEEEALELHAEILDQVQAKRRQRYGLCVLLGRMRDDVLWKHLGKYRSFEDYAVKVGAASSHTIARQLATLAKQLESLPLLRALFEQGKVDWTAIRDAARAATEKPEDEEFWAEEVQKSPPGLVRRKAQLALGEAPTRRTTLDLPLDVDALFDHYLVVLGQKLRVRVTKTEAIAHLLVSAIRHESWRDASELREEVDELVAVEVEADPEDDEPAPGPVSPQPCAPGAPSPDAAPAEPRATRSGPAPPSPRIPGPTSLLLLHECRTCHQVELDGSTGPVTLELGRTATFTQDAFAQDAEGSVRRTIPAKLRRRVFARDRGTCVVPGCGTRGFIDTHHEGPGGWKKTGHDEDRLFLLCTEHHVARHHGWLVIEGVVSTRLVFRNASGKVLERPQVSTWWPEPATPPSPANTACPTRVPGHAPEALRDARAALRQFKVEAAEAEVLLAVACAQLPASATAGELAAAAFRALR